MGENTQERLLKILSECRNIVISDDVRSYILRHSQPKVASKILYGIVLLNNNGLSLGENISTEYGEASMPSGN
jgi:hypothetical protein